MDNSKYTQEYNEELHRLSANQQQSLYKAHQVEQGALSPGTKTSSYIPGTKSSSAEYLDRVQNSYDEEY